MSDDNHVGEHLYQRLVSHIPDVRRAYDDHLARVGSFDAEEFFSKDLVSWLLEGFTRSQRVGSTHGSWRDALDYLDLEADWAHRHMNDNPDADVVFGLLTVDLGSRLPQPPDPVGEIREFLGETMLGAMPLPPPEAVEEGEKLARRLAEAVPAVYPLFREELSESKTFHSYLFFATKVVPWVVEQFLASRVRSESDGPWKDVLDALEREYQVLNQHRRSDWIADELANVIESSFLADLPEAGEPGHELLDYLGPEMRRYVRR